ncbi:thioesterase family protein [Sneathia sanguinegens]|uniref:thioesterase family protein n=1 Tax=Sneathia sanguinegens TaxID=40543 RepID=UPI00288A3924|nr:thioesterase family protein [Sneathia sanguinegens]MDU7496909.1 thioesterase family protein [Sneathia sanguinegens]
MKKILVNSSLKKEMIVKEKDLASIWGSGKARVYATPCMIAFMELTSTELIDQFLENDEITVGTMVNIKHLKASPLGSKITCVSKIIEVNSKAITLEVKCYMNDDILIGAGTHGRYVVEKEKFEKKCYEINKGDLCKK